MLLQLNLFVFRCLGLVCGFVCRWRSSIGGFAVFRGNPAIAELFYFHRGALLTVKCLPGYPSGLLNLFICNKLVFGCCC